MTEHDPLELELAALRPRKPSAELKQRIADRLAMVPIEQAARGRRPVSTRAALLGGVLAASALAVVVWHGREQTPDVPAVTAVPTLDADLAAAFDESIPSLWSYRSGLSQSSHTLDQLLDKYADQSFEHQPGGAPGSVLARFNSDTNSLLGEL
jgi:hypothetical protein